MEGCGSWAESLEGATRIMAAATDKKKALAAARGAPTIGMPARSATTVRQAGPGLLGISSLAVRLDRADSPPPRVGDQPTLPCARTPPSRNRERGITMKYNRSTTPVNGSCISLIYLVFPRSTPGRKPLNRVGRFNRRMSTNEEVSIDREGLHAQGSRPLTTGSRG